MELSVKSVSVSYIDRNRDIKKAGVMTAPACLFSMFSFLFIHA